MSLRVTVIILVLGFTGCAAGPTAWTGPPGRVDSSEIPRLWNWAGTPVTVVDARPRPAKVHVSSRDAGKTWESISEQIVQETRRILLEAVGRARVDAKYDLTVKIVEHGATFSAPNWVGKTRLTATLARFQDAPDSEWTATGQVVKWNWLGWDTARSASEEAYQAAITDLLRQLAASLPPPAR